jgi:transcriptional regulator with AAA-type ATPase domain
MRSHLPAPALFRDEDRARLASVARLLHANPFLPERTEAEHGALGPAFAGGEPGWCLRSEPSPHHENLRRLHRYLEPTLRAARDRLAAGAPGSDADLAIYQDACLFDLYDRFDTQLQGLIDSHALDAPFYDRFLEQYALYFRFPGSSLRPPAPEHLLALFFHARRAFFYIYTRLLGGSSLAAELRGAVWRACLTGNPRLYAEALYRQMDDQPVLVTGPSGTGKELVADIVAHARYVPFDPATRRFVRDHTADYHRRNLSDVAETLIDSALFGHKRGSFTGAESDAAGLLGMPKEGGTLFFDELAELPMAIQVKLLRVCQGRRFMPVGGKVEEISRGRFVFATNRDLAEEIRAGRFREDLLFRIRVFRIRTPSLRAQLDEAPAERAHLVKLFAAKVIPGPSLDEEAARIDRWIEANVPPDYPWPGNLRELELCVRALVFDGRYELEGSTGPDSAILGAEGLRARLPLVAIQRSYVTHALVANDQNKTETARQLGITWRAVTRLVDAALLARLLRRKRG